ncbi:ATP-dependent nuclease [Flavobacterium psychrotrophum]|uniref:ATP-dependent nuclease n=1 Tax=Flavobacterium psychrotrophum TaxID=2294119 RepID=UPI000E30D524|nr:AAA family ATPase [Flavobacterium psychrotrophum]
MTANIFISQIIFKTGLTIQLKKDSVVLFVGPNNSGKSLALKEIEKTSNGSNQSSKIIENIVIKAEGSAEDFLKRIEHRLKDGGYKYYHDYNSGMDATTLKSYWSSLIGGNNKVGAPAVANFFLKKHDTIGRLNLVAPAGNIDIMTELKTHPIHDLKQDQEKERTFSQFFRAAFGEDIIVNHGYGASVPLHVGTPPTSSTENDRVSKQYQMELRKLPFLHEQGDGMKSFAGVFLSLFIENFSINLVDEPEAFLHPPQSFLLGQMIAQTTNSRKQLLAATHSEHFLKGLLDSASERLIIVRIQRMGNTNDIHVLENSEIVKVWNDTLLRHSNILDGLFHKRVVLVESDSDCRFYSALTGAITDDYKLSSPDILFVPAGGKERFPVIIKALKALNVPLTIIGDFDLYQNENPLRKMYEELGGNFDEIKEDVKKVKKGIDEKIVSLKTEEFKKKLETILSKMTERDVPQDTIKELQSLIKQPSAWKQAKSSGRFYLPAGEITSAFNRVQSQLEKLGILILEIGEIEAFNKNVGGHGPKWVNEVLQQGILNSRDMEIARSFVKDKILKL